MTTSIVICRASSYPIRRMMFCPLCKCKRRMLHQDEAWYGMKITCCGCGNQWQDGELFRFNKKQLAESAQNAKAIWKETGPYDKEAHRRWVHAEIGIEE